MNEVFGKIRDFLIALFDKLQKLITDAFIGQHDQAVNPTEDEVTGADDLIDPMA
jgi:hypothetical protein